MSEVPGDLFTLTIRTISNSLNVCGVFIPFHVTPAVDDKNEEQQGLLPWLREVKGWLLHLQYPRMKRVWVLLHTTSALLFTEQNGLHN